MVATSVPLTDRSEAAEASVDRTAPSAEAVALVARAGRSAEHVALADLAIRLAVAAEASEDRVVRSVEVGVSTLQVDTASAVPPARSAAAAVVAPAAAVASAEVFRAVAEQLQEAAGLREAGVEPLAAKEAGVRIFGF